MENIICNAGIYNVNREKCVNCSRIGQCVYKCKKCEKFSCYKCNVRHGYLFSKNICEFCSSYKHHNNKKTFSIDDLIIMFVYIIFTSIPIFLIIKNR